MSIVETYSPVRKLEEVLKNKSKLGMNVTILPKDRRRRWVRLSDVLELVGDLEKSHIIKSRKEIQEMIDKTPIGDRKLRFTAGYIHALEKLLGDEK